MSLGIIGIDHVQIAVPAAQESACVAFYRDVLGLPEIPKPERLKARGGAWFQTGAVQIHIGLDPEPGPTSKRHICFLVADLAVARCAMLTQNIPIADDVPADSLQRFFIRDPAGNRIEIGQR